MACAGVTESPPKWCTFLMHLIRERSETEHVFKDLGARAHGWAFQQLPKTLNENGRD